MKKIKIIMLICLLYNISYADYSVLVPLEQDDGGVLPNGSIKINNQVVENWITATPEYTEWINSGSLYDCNNWTPDENTINIGTSFEQIATGNRLQTKSS